MHRGSTGYIDSKSWPERLLRINLREIFSFDENAARLRMMLRTCSLFRLHGANSFIY